MRRLALMFCILLSAALYPSVFAKSGAPDATVTDLSPVSVVAIREPLEFSYQRAYDAALKVKMASDDLAELMFILRDNGPAPLPPFSLVLEYGEKSTQIPVDENGSFTLEPNAEAAQQHARFVLNRHRKTVNIQVDLRPKISGTLLSTGEIERYVSAGQKARAALLPWYARIVTPAVNALRICSASGQSMLAKLPLDSNIRFLGPRQTNDAVGGKKFCVEAYVQPASSENSLTPKPMTLPSDATFEYEGSLF